MNAWELYDQRERAVDVAGCSGGYSEYLLRCQCAGTEPNMDEATFEAFKRLNGNRPSSSPFASLKPAFDEWRELLGEPAPSLSA